MHACEHCGDWRPGEELDDCETCGAAICNDCETFRCERGGAPATKEAPFIIGRSVGTRTGPTMDKIAKFAAAPPPQIFSIGRGVETRTGPTLDQIDMRRGWGEAVARASELSREYGGIAMIADDKRTFRAAVWGGMVFLRSQVEASAWGLAPDAEPQMDPTDMAALIHEGRRGSEEGI